MSGSLACPEIKSFMHKFLFHCFNINKEKKNVLVDPREVWIALLVVDAVGQRGQNAVALVIRGV